jgi:sporulation and cell division protein SsgA
MAQGSPPVDDSFERGVSAYLLQPDGARVPFPATLVFDKADPVAVSLRLRTTDVRTVTWTFARQLLIDGARRPTGVGAVEVRPAFHEGRRFLVLMLKSAGGSAQVQLPHEPVAAFLNDTFAAVPSGSEAEHVDWNAELAKFQDDGD